MTNSINNIKFNYLYRDGSNYKNFGSVIFHNPNNISINEVENSIRLQLIDGEYFYACQWNIPELFFEVPNSDDHEFHEFESIEVTNDREFHLPIEEFISIVSKT